MRVVEKIYIQYFVTPFKLQMQKTPDLTEWGSLSLLYAQAVPNSLVCPYSG